MNMIKLFTNILIALTLVFLASCKGAKDSKFSFLDTNSTEGQSQVTVKIDTFSPASDPVIMAATSQTTFAVSLVAADSTVTYQFLLDGTTILQSSSQPFYTFDASAIPTGVHTLKVTASNSTSSDSHTFNMKVNTPPSIASFTPFLSGVSLSCGVDSVNVSALYSEIDSGDVVSVKWFLNNSQIAFGNSQANIINDPSNSIAQVTYHPDCTQGGINSIRVELNDGKDTTTQTWIFSVITPITIHISDATPTVDPTVLTTTTSATFGVTLSIPDVSSRFDITLDNTIALAVSSRNPFYLLSGSSLTTGNHTLKIRAFNSNSSDTKTFNIRKNGPPTITGFSPAYTGTSVNCSNSPITLYADMLDPNGDSLSYTWTLDDAPSANLIPTNSGNHAQASFTPACAISGTRSIKLAVFDGYETTNLSWSINVNAPIAVNITSFSPTVSPIIITNAQTQTFAVALANSDPNISYTFTLKNIATTTTTTLQTSTVPFYNLVGSSIGAGNYELKVVASNGSSSDTKIFNVRKNSAPGVPPIGYTFSPALTGTAISCGVGSQIFQSDIADADTDFMTITWSVDGVTNNPSMVSTSNQVLAKATYTPSCSEVGIKTIKVDVFDGYETTSKSWSVQVYNASVNVSISSFSPSSDPTVVASTSKTTFAVSLVATDPSVTYTFLLDGTTTLQSGTNSFYQLDASTISQGNHTLKVTATNSISTDNKIFNIKVNHPPALVSFTPTLSGTSLACGIDNSNFNYFYSEVDAGDTVQIKWYLNNALIGGANTTASVTNDPANSHALMNFHPDCTQTGINFIRLDLYDGHETVSTTWTVYVTAPVTINISDWTPTTDPTVMTATSTTTFAVALTTPDSNAKYDFTLDGVTTLQSNTNKAYYALAGSGLTPGNHTLLVKAYNTNSFSNKTFNIRKNSVPAYTGFSPAFSGNTVNCGTAPITLYADMFDANGDTLSYTWTLDDVPSSYLTANNAGNRAQASFNPSCAISGTRVIKALVSDGYESVTLTWSVTVATPIAVQISSFLPATNPTVLTNAQTTTFAIALTNSDPNVTYNFTLKNLTTLATTTLQSGTVPFYNLVGSSISAGLYELKALASNGTSSDSHTFTVRKNSPPSLPPVGFTFSPALSGTSLSCGSSVQVFQSDLSDADGDIMSITWSLDGNTSAPNLVSTSSQTKAKATYTPNCTEVGVKTIKVDVFDGYETTSMTWTVQIINPTIVAINAYTPSADPINVLSTGSQTFTISATGKAPLNYEWKLDGTIVQSTTDAYYTLSSASLTTGVHTLICKVTDSDSNKSHTFNIIKNSPPTISNLNPSNLTAKINVNTVKTFSANYSDANGDAMTVVWKLNNVTVGASNPNASVTSGAGSTTLTFTPSASLLGDNAVNMIISDGKEAVTTSWVVNVNYFSDACNNMGAGRICTLLGQPGMGSNVNPQSTPQRVRIQPDYIEPYGDAAGSYFFTDAISHSLWFYNKSISTVNILNQSISANTLKVLAGTGMNGSGTGGTQTNDYPFTNPKGLAWDSANQRLFMSDDSNSRVVMIDNTGAVTIVFGGGGNNAAGNTDGQPALNSYCQYPYGLAYSSAQSRLYVGCYGSHTIKYVDTSNATYTNWTASILVGALAGGVSSAGTVDGVNGSAGAAKVNAPTKLKFDPTNKILYSSSAGDCRVKAHDTNNTTKTNYYYGAVTLTANNTKTLTGGGCGTYATGGYAAIVLGNSYRNGLELDMTGATLNGVFFSDFNNHRIMYINNTASVRTYGSVGVPANSGATVWGNGTAGYYMPCSSAVGVTCYLNNPAGMSKIGTKLYLTDYSNFRIRNLDLSVNNGAVVDDIGYDSKQGYGGNGGASSETVQFNTPLNLNFDNSSGKLYVSDFYNYRIRSVNLTTGRIDSFISNGNGSANSSNADPTTLGMQGPRGAINYNNFILFGDTSSMGTASRNCVIRALNTQSTTQTILGISTNASMVQTVIGSYVNGCGAWNATATTGTNVNARLNEATSLTTDGSNIYFVNSSDHCIIKVDQNGNMGSFSGLCGTAGAANAAGTAFGNTALRFNYPTAIFTDPRTPYTSAGNLFILDQSTTTYSQAKIRYINQYSSAVTIYGVTVNPGEIKTIYTAPDNYGADLAAFDNQICYSTGGGMVNYTTTQGTSNNANNTVICFNRDDSTGTTFSRFGRNPSVFIGRGAVQQDQEDEGALATSASFAGPSGLAFDGSGNLYIAERNAHVIRKITKWW